MYFIEFLILLYLLSYSFLLVYMTHQCFRLKKKFFHNLKRTSTSCFLDFFSLDYFLWLESLASIYFDNVL